MNNNFVIDLFGSPCNVHPLKAIRRGNRTIIVWDDGKRSIVRLHNEDNDDEKAVAMAYLKRYLHHNTFKKLVANMEFQDED